MRVDRLCICAVTVRSFLRPRTIRRSSRLNHFSPPPLPPKLYLFSPEFMDILTDTDETDLIAAKKKCKVEHFFFIVKLEVRILSKHHIGIQMIFMKYFQM